MKKIDIACIIDDDPIYIFGMKRIMELADFCKSFMIFNNGKEALDKLKPMVTSGDKLPDIILLDLNMPVMDGWQFLDEFTKIPSDKEILIYIVSSSIDPEDIKKAEGYGLTSSYIVKPVTVKTLKAILSSI